MARDDESCPHCLKGPHLCICDSVTPLVTRTKLVILQHPQEQDRDLGTARLAAYAITGAMVRTGLSWPSLSKLLGHAVDPQRWGVLYLGSIKAKALAPDRVLVAVDRKGEMLDRQESILHGLEGIILLDGTWSQAKAIWWRNAWLLKCRRLVLNPEQPSRYGKLRREARRDGLSTIEAAALVLTELERDPTISMTLNAHFQRMLDAYVAVRR